MRLLIQSAMIFFGTLLAAGLLALGEPQASAPATQAGAERSLLLVLQGAWPESTAAPSGR
jgi:hypothetical protein